MNAVKKRTPEEEDALIRAFLMPKAPPIPPSSFDVASSTAPTAMAGKVEVPPINDFMDFKLTMDDPYAPPVEEPAPMAPVVPMVKKPSPNLAQLEPKPAPAPDIAFPPAAPAPEGPSDREKMMEKLKNDDWISVIGKALSGLADARMAKEGQKSNFFAGANEADTAARDRTIKEFDTAAKIKKDEAEAKAKNDPTSPRSKAYQDLMVEYFPGKDFSKLSAAQIEEVIGPVGKMADAREARLARQENAKIQRDSLKAERDRRYDERRQKDKTEVVGKFNKATEKIEASIDAANNIRGLVDSDNPIAASAVPTFMARASGEVGNLSEADKRPFGGSQALLSRLEAALTQKANGRLTRENAVFIKQLADVMEKRAIANKDRRARELSLQYAAANDYLDANDLYETLRPGGSGGAKAKGPQPGDVVDGYRFKGGSPSDQKNWEPI